MEMLSFMPWALLMVLVLAQVLVVAVVVRAVIFVKVLVAPLDLILRFLVSGLILSFRLFLFGLMAGTAMSFDLEVCHLKSCDFDLEGCHQAHVTFLASWRRIQLGNPSITM